MKLRRRLHDDQATLLQFEDASGSWADLPTSDAEGRNDFQWLLPPSPLAPMGGTATLPFAPASFRDCSLYEEHWIQSSRGYAKRFLPLAYLVARAYEAVSGGAFPAFKPHALSRKQPLYYFGNHLTFVASGTPVKVPRYTRALDYELELGFVLARPLLDATPEEALAAIGGFVVVNDWSARDVQRSEMQSGLGPQKCKHFLTSMSETLVTADEILPHIDDLTAFVELNGRLVVRTCSAGMSPSLGEVIAHLSRSEQLFPGELIATGTLPNGSGMENGHWPRLGDRVRLIIEPIGEITHEII